MRIFDIFTSEREKSHRRSILARRFDAVLEDYLSSKKYLEYFMTSYRSGEYVFLSYSPSRGYVGVSTRRTSVPYSSTNKEQAVNLTALKEFSTIYKLYEKLDTKNLQFDDIYSFLSDALCDLVTEAVTEFEKHFSLPKAD